MNALCTILMTTAIAATTSCSLSIAHAQDRGQIEVSNKGVVKMFELRTTDGGELVSRRVMVQYLGMAASRSVDDDEGPHLSTRVWLRLDSDLGLESTVARRLDHPDRRFVASDLQLAYVRVDDLFGRLDLTLGRDLLVDPVSAQTLDGAQVRLDSPSGWFVRGHVGMPVVPSRALTFDSAFGEPWTDIGAQSYKDELVTVGGGIGFSSQRTRVQIAARRTASISDDPALLPPVTLPTDTLTGAPLADDRLGFSLYTRALPAFELSANAVGDLALDTLSQGRVEGLLHIADHTVAGLRAEAFTPTFPIGSVFSVFGARPTTAWLLIGGYDDDTLTLDATGGVRAYGDPDQFGLPMPFDTQRGAAHATLRAHWHQPLAERRWLTEFDLDAGLRAEGGHGGTLLMADAGASAQILRKQLRAQTRVITFYAEPEHQPQLGGWSGGAQLAMDANISDRSTLALTTELTSTTAFVGALRIFILYELHYQLMD